jgi:hypothetical protein
MSQFNLEGSQRDYIEIIFASFLYIAHFLGKFTPLENLICFSFQVKPDELILMMGLLGSSSKSVWLLQTGTIDCDPWPHLHLNTKTDPVI